MEQGIVLILDDFTLKDVMVLYKLKMLYFAFSFKTSVEIKFDYVNIQS